MKRSLIYTAVFSAMLMVTGCGGGGGDEGVTITNQPANQVDKDNKGEDNTKNIDNDEAEIILTTALETITAPYPISKAKKLSIGQSVEISNEADIYYAVELTELGLYSFDIGTLNEKNTNYNGGWEIYDATGTEIDMNMSYNLGYSFSWRWTPPAAGIYYIRPKQGTVLKIKKHGTASADPYTIGKQFWVFDKLTLTGNREEYKFSQQLTNLYANEVYRIKYRNSGPEGDMSLTTVSGKEIYSSKIGNSETLTLQVSGLDSDTYIIGFKGTSRVTGITIDRLPDSDGDGDPDETDPYPNDPVRNSNSGNNNTSGGNGTDDKKIENCKKPYTGDSSDPQVYTFDYIAQVAQCSYRATGNTSYLTYGDTQCQVLDGLLSSIKNKFRPQYCSGSKMIR
ncbi:hypothetical protein [Acinetobacter sp. Ac_5812]|uniref:hypothetical protein n=1 Tax=Acinetobacter sp. Ac_5812 TaxID=1848937 RepID=UPI00148F48BF|nr:hypothetical protein [Acinetobacter sp. Ac_5812]NNP70991.1 hypothetical protein [Acinetobacter sp. Ac_5812]